MNLHLIFNCYFIERGNILDGSGEKVKQKRCPFLQKHLLTLIKWDPLTLALPNPEPFMPAREATKERTEWADNKGSATSSQHHSKVV